MDDNCLFCGIRCARATNLLLNLLFSMQVYQNDNIGNTVTRARIEKTQSLSSYISHNCLWPLNASETAINV